ncbi:MAG TPA: hypothetical protein VM782_18825 [Stellaceae bacterium]|nr:hypothetical protein [Stellaceae bacterium]
MADTQNSGAVNIPTFTVTRGDAYSHANPSTVVGSGSTAPQAPITKGTTEVVQSGGTAVSPTIAGGTLALAQGSTVQGSISFAPGTTGGLLFDDSGRPDTVVGFSEGSDFLSFAGETAASAASVIASATSTSSGTLLTYPDGSSVFLLGVNHVDIGIFA